MRKGFQCQAVGIVVTIALLLAVSAFAAEIKIVHINVGQGDATLILGPRDNAGNRVSVLVDAGDISGYGGKDGGNMVRAVLRKNSVDTLDYFVATHYHSDHVGGTAAGGTDPDCGHSFLLGENNVPGELGDDDGDDLENWLDADPEDMIRPDPEELGEGDDIDVLNFVDRGDSDAPEHLAHFQKYRSLAEAKSGRRRCVGSQADVNSFTINLGDGAEMRLLAADGYVRGQAERIPGVDDENERSLCFLLHYGGFDYLIGGDLTGQNNWNRRYAKVEPAIGEYIRNEEINVDVLRVNHHGSNTSSAEEFLLAIRPEIAIISLGNRNTHRHPNKYALSRLAAAGVRQIIQTEWGSEQVSIPEEARRYQAIYQGDIIITSDGQTYEISTSRRYPVDH